MSNALEEHGGKVSIGGRNINTLWFVDDTDAFAHRRLKFGLKYSLNI